MLRIPRDQVECYDEDTFMYKGVPLTGIVYVKDQDGILLMEETYLVGYKTGKLTHWNAKTLKVSYEGTCLLNAAHGTMYSYYPSGQLRSEERCEYGVPVAWKEYDENGKLTKESGALSDGNRRLIEKRKPVVDAWFNENKHLLS